MANPESNRFNILRVVESGAARAAFRIDIDPTSRRRIAEIREVVRRDRHLSVL